MGIVTLQDLVFVTFKIDVQKSTTLNIITDLFNRFIQIYSTLVFFACANSLFCNWFYFVAALILIVIQTNHWSQPAVFVTNILFKYILFHKYRN